MTVRSTRNQMTKTLEKSRESFSLLKLIKKRVHILQWLPNYTKSDVISDFIAGLTVGLTMMPQSIAYANLAGLQAQYGLYTAFIGSFTYVFFGTIKEVSIGPTSLMALLAFSYIEDLPIEFVILLTLLVGCVEFLMGLFKLGFLVDFISPCVTSGFTSAMSIIITTAQLKNIFGLQNLKNHGILSVYRQIITRYDEIQLADTSLGIACIIFLFIFRQFPKIKTENPVLKKTLWFLSISKNALIVLLTSILGFYFFEYQGGSPFLLSGAVPSGLPAIKLPSFSSRIGNETVNFLDMVEILGSSIIVLPIAGVLANVAIAKAFAVGVVVDATQEMMTLGICNIFGAFVQAMPSCGAFTRSAVASTSGVRTPLQGVYSGTIIILALSFLTPYFYYIPRATLAAVLISAIVPMFDYEIFPKLWKCNKFDFVLTLGTLLIGVFYGVEMGIILGGIFNLIILLKMWTRPEMVKEIRSDEFGNSFIYLRPEIGLFYPAVDYLSTIITETVEIAPEMPVVIDCANIVKIDYPSCQLFNNLLKNYNKTSQKLSFINVKPQILRLLRDQISSENLGLCKPDANGVEVPLLKRDELNGKKMVSYDHV